MKILFINISDIKGGAAKAVWRVAQQLEKDYDTENLFLVRDKFSNQANVIATRSNKLIYKIEWAINVFFNLIGLQYKFLPFSSHIILKIARKFKPDVISLNQIEGGYFQTRDMIKLGKIAPIVWTMHDLWAVNNNSHRVVKEGEKEKNIYPSIGIKWGNWLKKQKIKIYQTTRPIYVLPSAWMAKYMNLINNNVIYTAIPHGIDLEKFKPAEYDPNNYNTQVNIPTLLFVAEKIEKGGELLWQILDELDKLIDFRVKVYLIGENKGNYKNTYKNISTYGTGYIWDENELIEYYQQADVFVYPSSADVFGLVLIEAMACGLPVIVSSVDAIPEVVKHNGMFCQSAKEFAMTIHYLLGSIDHCYFHKRIGRNITEDYYDIKQTAEKYYQLFKGEIK